MELSKENILVNTNGGLDVFEYFITSFPGINKAFLNPFYNDTKASCYVFRDPGSMICRFVDFGNSDFNGDCFSLVGQVFGKDSSNGEDFLWILSVINIELSLGLKSKTSSLKDKRNRFKEISKEVMTEKK